MQKLSHYKNFYDTNSEASVVAHAGQNRAAGVADASGSSQQLLFKLCFCLYKTRCKYCEGFYDINPCCFRLKSVSSIILRSNHALGANHHLRNQILALIMGLTLASLSLKLLGRRLSLTSTTSCPSLTRFYSSGKEY